MTDSSTGPIAAEMTRRLIAALAPTRLDLEDQSHHHVGHAGHDGRGESHFHLVVQSAAFAGLNRVQRQRLVYRALGDLMTDQVHALSMVATAPGDSA